MVIIERELNFNVKDGLNAESFKIHNKITAENNASLNNSNKLNINISHVIFFIQV